MITSLNHNDVMSDVHEWHSLAVMVKTTGCARWLASGAGYLFALRRGTGHSPGGGSLQRYSPALRCSGWRRKLGFILESLPEMPQAALCEAGDELFAGLQRMMPGYCCEKTALGL